MQKKEKILTISCVVLSLFLILNFCVIFYFMNLSTSKIFDKNILKVVEIKVSDDEVTWGYATGCFINSNGTILTNKHVAYNSATEKNYEVKFENVNTSQDNNSYYFSGEISFDAYDLLSTNYEGEDVKEKYSSSIDKQDESISIGKDVVVNNEIVTSISETFTTRYDKENDIYYLIDEKGNEIDILAELEDENVNECFVLTATFISLTVAQIITICVVSAISITIIANADTISDDLSVLTEGVRDGFTSFWDGIKLKLGKITAVALASVIGILTTTQAKKIYKQAEKRKDCYLLLAPVSSTEPLAIVFKFTNLENARNWIKKGGSVWSPYGVTARDAIKSAGYQAGGYSKESKIYIVNLVEHHKSLVNMPTFDHYHTILGTVRVNDSCHSFFGLPYRSEA